MNYTNVLHHGYTRTYYFIFKDIKVFFLSFRWEKWLYFILDYQIVLFWGQDFAVAKAKSTDPGMVRVKETFTKRKCFKSFHPMNWIIHLSKSKELCPTSSIQSLYMMLHKYMKYLKVTSQNVSFTLCQIEFMKCNCSRSIRLPPLQLLFPKNTLYKRYLIRKIDIFFNLLKTS